MGYPNRELELSFSRCLAQGFTNLAPEDITGALHRLLAALRENHLADMLETLSFFFSKVPNTIAIENEKYYQTIFFTIFKLIGVSIETLNTGTGSQVRETPAANAADAADKLSSRESDRKEIARRLKTKGIAPDIIAEVTGVTP